MAILIAISAFLAPLVLIVAAWAFPVLRFWIEGLALASAYVFGLLIAVYLAGVIEKGTVMMTDIHRIFLNPLFLTAGAYLGVYTLYKLAFGWLKLWQE